MTLSNILIFVAGFISGEIAALLVLTFFYGAYKNDREQR